MKLVSSPLKIFFCDLTYDSIILVSDTIPINIGFIASYAKKIFKNEISTKLFKYPNDTINSINENKPDLICLSNYSWNSNLSEHIASIAKKANPNIITAQGGPNFPHDDEQQIEFLKSRPATDIFMIMEGEITTTNIIKRVIDCKLDRKKILSSPIDGTVFIEPSSRNNKQIQFIKGGPSKRIKFLDEIPSPYLTGILDPFFDGKLTPFIETNRGCPFKCSFCHTGADYFQKIHMFSVDRIKEEIEYIAKKASKIGITNLHIADTNFGMYPRDREITKALLHSHNKYKWPISIMSTTGKNNKARVIDITSMLGNMFSVNMSAQSMDDKVLQNIRRSNISLEDYKDINKHLRKHGRSTKAELIMLLPGETRNSFVKGVEEVIDSGVSQLTIYTLMLLYGTEFKNPDYRKKFNYKGKFRIVPLNFGEYDNKKIFDYEEVGVQNKDISFNEYLKLRGLALLVETLLNGRPFDEFFMYIDSLGVSKIKLLDSFLENMRKAPKKVKDIYNDFIKESEEELWDSENELLNHYRKKENYQKLKEGLVGGNLIYKYKVKSIVLALNEWLDFFESTIYKIISNSKKINIEDNELKNQLSNIAKFCKNKLHGLFDLTMNQRHITTEFDYDIINWIDNIDKNSLYENKLSHPIKYTFGFTQDQATIRRDQLNRYGSDLNALSKIVTRISNLEGLFRKIKTNENIVRDIYPSVSGGERFTRYTLAN